MRRDSMAIIVFSAVILFSPGCSWEPGIDKTKFSELNRTAQDLKAVLASAQPCDMPDTLLQRLVSGTAALKDKTASKAERDLIADYEDLASICRDGLLLCRSSSHLTAFEFVPKGRIYVTQELDPVVEKYGLATQKHLYKPTGQYWRSVAGDSVKVIWESAEARIKSIEVMVKYN